MPELFFKGKEFVFNHHLAVPFRPLIPDPQRSIGASGEQGRLDGNLIIHGDNLHALKALLPLYAGKVDCIFIDPPYNTKSAFEHYDDNLEHSQWLSMMLPRLQLLRELLRDDGSIWVTIDDNEGHYLKVLMDEVFGRGNFVTSFQWQKTLTRRNDAKVVSGAHDHVLLYARNASQMGLHRPGSDDRQRATYKNREATREAKEWLGDVGIGIFSTPKPERLIQRVLTLATAPGNLVLDSFLGSGTTAAVAHKMGRRWIGIEMGEHAAAHCLPRLQKVIYGEACRLGAARLAQAGVTFRHIPYDVKAR
ncbi:MAG: site-specific DNA-methyltransferase [Chromatiaceae bacterium]